MTNRIRHQTVLLASAACVAFSGLPARAQQTTDRTQMLEERVRQLEDALREVRQELDATRREASAAAQAQAQPPAASASTAVAVAPAEPAVPPVPATESVGARQSAQAQPPGAGFRIGDTTFRISGFIKADTLISSYSNGDTATNSLGRDFYLPHYIPTNGAKGEGADFDAHTKQTRIILSTETPVGDKTLTAHIESDFQTSPGTQGSERTTNGYNLALRRAFIGYGAWTMGQDWSNFQNATVLPEAADFVGVTEGTVFIRQMQVRYSHKLSDVLSVSVALENPETSSVAPFSSALVENDDDHLPDATVKFTYAPSFGQFTLAGLVRQLSVNTPEDKARAFSWGISGAGRIPFGRNDAFDVRFMLTYGDGISRYVGFNFAPDVITVIGPDGTTDLEKVKVLAGFLAFHVSFTDKLRSNLMGSFQDVNYPSGIAPGTANEQAHSIAVNLFYSPIRLLDLGIEYRYAQLKLLNGDKGSLNRLHLVAKHAF